MVAASRNSGKILMTQEVKIEYHHRDDDLEGVDMLDERGQGQYVHEMEDMGRQRNA